MENICREKSKWGINQHNLTVFSLVYLALHSMLFFSSWFTPRLAWPVNLGILSTICYYAVAYKSADSWSINKKNIIALIFTALLCFASILNAGVAGFIKPDSDVLIFREALFSNLVNAPWPLVLPNGQEMTYYLAGGLPGAMLARLTDDYTTQRVLASIWASLGLWLALLLFFCRARNISLLFVLLLFFFKEPFYLILNSFAGNGDVWALLSHYLPLPENQYQGVRAAFITIWGSGQTYTFTPCTLLCFSLLINEKNPKSYILLVPFVVALLIPVSPLAAIGCMPVALYLWFRHNGIVPMCRLLSLIIPVGITYLCAEYYLRAESDTCVGIFGSLMGNWHHYLTSWYATPFLGGLLFLFILYPVLKNDHLLLISIICILTLPLIYFGSTVESRIFGNNEMWLKASPMYNMHILAALCYNWKKLSKVKYIFILSTVVMSLHLSYQEGFRWSGSAAVDDVWNGHLHHEHTSLYQKTPSCTPTMTPDILLHNGEAEKFFPGNILPKAPGCDYSRPANWHLLPPFLRV